MNDSIKGLRRGLIIEKVPENIKIKIHLYCPACNSEKINDIGKGYRCLDCYRKFKIPIVITDKEKSEKGKNDETKRLE